MEERERQEEEEEEEENSNNNSIVDEIWSWGAGTDGQLATTKLQDQHFPQLVSSSFPHTPKPISHLSCGGAHVIALSREDGKVLTWGRGTSGQLGHGDNQNYLHPLPLLSLESLVVSHVSAGWNHSGFVTNTGRVFTCGDGTFGQLGHGDYLSQNLPSEIVKFGSKFVEQIACGMRHTLVLLKGTLGEHIYGFGSGKRGQLSVAIDNVKKSCTLPEIVSGFEDIEIASVAANGDQSAAITVVGHLYTWGKGFHGKKHAQHMLLPPSTSKFTQVALGWNHALVLTDYAKVFMLGGNRHGMLSDPQACLKKCPSGKSGHCQGPEDESNAQHFVEVPGLDGIKVANIAAGAEHSALVTENGTLMTWGWGEHGQLGLGNEEDKIAPHTVSLGAKHAGNQTKVSIYCGSGFTFAIVRKSSTSQTSSV